MHLLAGKVFPTSDDWTQYLKLHSSVHDQHLVRNKQSFRSNLDNIQTVYFH